MCMPRLKLMTLKPHLFPIHCYNRKVCLPVITGEGAVLFRSVCFFPHSSLLLSCFFLFVLFLSNNQTVTKCREFGKFSTDWLPHGTVNIILCILTVFCNKTTQGFRDERKKNNNKNKNISPEAERNISTNPPLMKLFPHISVNISVFTFT
jgi:hypothetical protein